MGNLIYKVKDNIDINEFGKIGYDIFPQSNDIVFKFVPQPLEGEVVQGSLNGIYNNQKWIKQFYNANKKRVKEAIGLKYNKKGEAVLTKRFVEVLTNWRIQIDFEDRWVGFKSLDPFDNQVFYAKQVLDLYCEEEIKFLLEKGVIETIEVE